VSGTVPQIGVWTADLGTFFNDFLGRTYMGWEDYHPTKYA